MRKKLVIFDFDGVVADSEKIWLENRRTELNKRYNLNWDFETTIKYIGGMRDKSKREVLDSLGINTDDEFPFNITLPKSVTITFSADTFCVEHITNVVSFW